MSSGELRKLVSIITWIKYKLLVLCQLQAFSQIFLLLFFVSPNTPLYSYMLIYQLSFESVDGFGIKTLLFSVGKLCLTFSRQTVYVLSPREQTNKVLGLGLAGSNTILFWT